MRKADFHTHTYFSDGGHSPEELVRLAKQKGISILALTDHNTVKGVQRAMAAGKRIGVEVLPGVEVQTREGEVAGHFIDYEHPKLERELRRYGYGPQERAKRICAALHRKGHDISFTKLQQMFPHAKDNYNTGHLFGYFIQKEMIAKRKDAIDILGQVRIRPPRKKDISMVTAIRMIRRYNGVAVLHHPWLSPDTLKEENIRRYVKAGLQGIELNNGEGPGFGRTKRIVERIQHIAKKYDLVMTKGSDYHSDGFTALSKGHYLGRCHGTEKTVEQLFKRKN